MKRLAIFGAAALVLVGSNWASMNFGFEYGSDVAGCIAFDMMSDVPSDEIVMCPRAADSPLLPARKLWLRMHGDQIPEGYFTEPGAQP